MDVIAELRTCLKYVSGEARQKWGVLGSTYGHGSFEVTFSYDPVTPERAHNDVAFMAYCSPKRIEVLLDMIDVLGDDLDEAQTLLNDVVKENAKLRALLEKESEKHRRDPGFNISDSGRQT